MMMSLRADAVSRPLDRELSVRPSASFLGVSVLSFLRPLAAKLVGIGITANQVTLASLAGSVAIGAVLCSGPDNSMLFILLSLWLPVRTACAAIDGTMAVEFGQKSRVGGVLHEVGDIASDVALFLPVSFVASFSANSIGLLIALIVLAEIAGILGPMLGSDRRLEGPLGKADRSVILAMLGVVIAVRGSLPEGVVQLLPSLLCGGLMLTVWNRLRFAAADRGRVSG